VGYVSTSGERSTCVGLISSGTVGVLTKGNDKGCEAFRDPKGHGTSGEARPCHIYIAVRKTASIFGIDLMHKRKVFATG